MQIYVRVLKQDTNNAFGMEGRAACMDTCRWHIVMEVQNLFYDLCYRGKSCP
jgi:hypothetical protein